MKNFIEFSHDSFVDYCTSLDGYICYKNDGNRIIFADRFGSAFKWSNHDGVVTATELSYPKPSELDCDDIAWLREIATKKHWKGGVEKLNSYETTAKSELDERGIDPYFYAWMASRHYEKEIRYACEERDFNPAVVTEDEYNRLVTIAPTIGCDGDEIWLVNTYIAEKDLSNKDVDTFVLSVKVLDDEKSALRDTIGNLVDDFIPQAKRGSAEHIIALKNEILQLMLDNGAVDM